MSANSIALLSARDRRFTADTMPVGMPMRSQRTTPPTMSVTLIGTRSISSDLTGTLLA